MICKECGKEFELAEEEKEFFVSKKLELPKRCKPCRAARKKACQEARKGLLQQEG